MTSWSQWDYEEHDLAFYFYGFLFLRLPGPSLLFALYIIFTFYWTFKYELGDVSWLLGGATARQSRGTLVYVFCPKTVRKAKNLPSSKPSPSPSYSHNINQQPAPPSNASLIPGRLRSVVPFCSNCSSIPIPTFSRHLSRSPWPPKYHPHSSSSSLEMAALAR
jgi:hypothetical protein